MYGRDNLLRHNHHIPLVQCSWPSTRPYFHCTALSRATSPVSLVNRTNNGYIPLPVGPDRVCRISRRNTAADLRARGPVAGRRVSVDRASTENDEEANGEIDCY